MFRSNDSTKIVWNFLIQMWKDANVTAIIRNLVGPLIYLITVRNFHAVKIPQLCSFH